MSISKLLLSGAFVIISLVIMQILHISFPVSVTISNKSSEFSVVGEGKVEARPDVSYVDAGIVVSNAKSVDEAQSMINEVNTKIVSAMGRLNISKSDIKTSNYSLYPNYATDPTQPNKIAGYNGNVTVSIKVRDTNLTSHVIEETTKAGANQIQGARFEIDDPNKFQEQARDMAIKNAKVQAEKLSKSLGIRLGKIVNIVESNQGSPMVPMMMAEGKGLGGGGPQIEPGSQTVTSLVTLYFEKY